MASLPKTVLASRFGVRAREGALADRRAHPLVVGAVGQDELDLVARPDVLRFDQRLRCDSPAARALEVHDLVHARVDAGHVGLAARLDEDRAPGVAQLAHQREHAGLEQRLAARELDERRPQRERAREDVGAGHARAAVEGLRRVAPGAAQVAPVVRTKVQGSPANVDSPWMLA